MCWTECGFPGIPGFRHSRGEMFPVLGRIQSCGYRIVEPQRYRINGRSVRRKNVRAYTGMRLKVTGEIEMATCKSVIINCEEIQPLVSAHLAEGWRLTSVTLDSWRHATRCEEVEDHLSGRQASDSLSMGPTFQAQKYLVIFERQDDPRLRVTIDPPREPPLALDGGSLLVGVVALAAVILFVALFYL